MRGGVIVGALVVATFIAVSAAGAGDVKVGNQASNNVDIDKSVLSPSGDTSLTLCPDGSFIVTNSTAAQSVSTGLNLTLTSVAWRPDGAYALIVGQGGTLIKYHLKSGMVMIDSGTSEDLTTVSWKPDGSFALITGANGMVIRFDHDTQRCLRIPTNTDLKLKDVQWDTSGEHAEITGENGTSIIYPPIEETRPAVAISSPLAGSPVAGVFTVSGTASVESGAIVRVESRIDSGGWLPVTGTDSWEIAFDARPYENGLHTVFARAWSSSDEVAQASVELSFENFRLPPLITVLAPSDCAAVAGTITIEGTASAFSASVERVDIRIDDFEWCRAVGTGFWRLSLDTTTMPNGVHRIQARAWDGAQFSAASRLVVVANARPLPEQREARPVPGPVPVVQLPATAPEPARPDAPTQLPALPPAPVPAASRTAPPMKDGGTIEVPAYSWAMLIVTALALGTEPGKYAFFQFFFVPLYSRIKKDAVLDNFTRGMIYGFIMSNPGVHYNFIKQRLGLNNGSIVYHLTVLERQELIKSEKVGLYKRFYPVGQTLSETGIMELNDTQQAMLDLVRGEPGLTQREVADRLGLSCRVVNYHVGLLQRARLVALEKDGKVTRCFATERMPVC
jgi:DNA-binding transcriptional ArsR family regulator